MRCHFLCVLERATVGEVGGNAGCAKRVAADFLSDARRRGSLSDHAPSVGLSHMLFGQHRTTIAAAGPE